MNLSFNQSTIQVHNEYFDVTNILKRYPNKNPSEWWNSKATKEYAEGMARKLNVEISTFYITSRGRYGSTQIHEKLIIFFARWLDVEFAIACDEFIQGNIRKLKSENQRLQIKHDAFWRQWDREDNRDLFL